MAGVPNLTPGDLVRVQGLRGEGIFQGWRPGPHPCGQVTIEGAWRFVRPERIRKKRRRRVKP